MVSKDKSFYSYSSRVLSGFSGCHCSRGTRIFHKASGALPKDIQHFYTSEPRVSSLCLPLRGFHSPTPVTCFLVNTRKFCNCLIPYGPERSLSSSIRLHAVQRLEDACLDSQTLEVSELEFELWMFLAEKSRFFHTVL